MNLRNLLLAFVLALGSASCAQLPPAQEIAPKMYPGWNLGNTMEANTNGANFTNNVGLRGETAWQRTKTTQAVIDFVKSQGFRSVRIPCNWICGHVTTTHGSTYTIDSDWMARVREVVDYCISAGLYVVLNDHYDGGWVEKSFTDISDNTVSKNCDIMRQIWTQIATAFKDYDEHLLLAGLNEPDCDTQAKTNALVKYEQAFIDAVRATGGNNATRTLIVQGPSTDIDKTYLYFNSLPTDPAADRLMVEVHYYTPSQFTGVWENGTPCYFWGSVNHMGSGTYASYNATWGEEDYLKKRIDKIKRQFVNMGIPVIIGEYGANWRNIGDTQAQAMHDASIRLYHKTICEYAVNAGMVPFVWDINVPSRGGKTGIMTVLDRNARSVFCSPAMEGITEGVKAAKWGSATTTAIDHADITESPSPASPAYTLQGQQTTTASKGIVVLGGRKYWQQ